MIKAAMEMIPIKLPTIMPIYLVLDTCTLHMYTVLEYRKPTRSVYSHL